MGSVASFAMEPPAEVEPMRQKAREMNIRLKIGGIGKEVGKLDCPHGICLGRNDEIVIADTNNHRIQVTRPLSCKMARFTKNSFKT
jgi:hypothetical protein